MSNIPRNPLNDTRRAAQHRVAMWDVTYYCNLACHHCYNQENLSKQIDDHLPPAQGLAVIDRLAHDGFDEINLVGGEPLSVPHIALLVEHGLECGKTVSINTNGLLLTKQLAERFVRLGFSRIAFSIAGLQEATNAPVRGRGVLRRVQGNIRYFVNRLLQAGVSNYTSINLSVTAWNVDDLLNLYTFCCELGVPSASVHLTQPMGAALDHPDVIENDANRILDGFEALIQRWGKDIALTLDTRPATTHYLSQKYRLRQGVIPADCPGGDRNVCIQPDGIQLACRLQTMHKRTIATFDVPLPDDKSRSFVEWKANVQKPAYCTTCPFLEVCTPCPLIVREGQPAECSVALMRNAEYNRWVMDQPLYKAPGIQKGRTDDGRPTLSLEGKQYQLSASGWAVWQAISEGTPIRDLITPSFPHLTNGTHAHGIMDFVHNLRKRGLVSLANDIQPQLPIRCVLMCCAR